MEERGCRMKNVRGPLYLGVDIGTQSVKVCVFDSDGRMKAKHTETQYLKTPSAGWAEESPRQWWELIVKGIKAVLRTPEVRSDQIRAMGVDAVMHSPVAIGKNGEMIEEDVQLYCDKRTVETVEELGKSCETLKYQQLTGNPFSPHLMGIKIRWIKQHKPQVYENTCKFISGKDYINYILTGQIATDASEASGTGVFDQRNDTWSETAAEILGIETEKFPVIRKASEVIGYVRPEIARLTGLSEKTQVVCGGGDMLCALYGAGMVRKGFGFDVTGTGSIVGIYNEQPVCNPDVTNVRHVIAGWTPYCCIDSSGGALRWARDVLCKKEVELSKGDPYDSLTMLAQKVPNGAEGILFFPYLQGLRQMDMNHARGVFMGMTPATTTGHLIRAVMEGVAYEHKRYYEEFDKYENVKTIIHTGGASNSPFWSQLKADIYDKEIVIPVHDECTALGSAMLAMVGTGAYRDELEAAVITAGQYKEKYEPDPDARDRYSQYFEVFREVSQILKQPFDRLADIQKGK